MLGHLACRPQHKYVPFRSLNLSDRVFKGILKRVYQFGVYSHEVTSAGHFVPHAGGMRKTIMDESAAWLQVTERGPGNRLARLRGPRRPKTRTGRLSQLRAPGMR